MPPPNKNFIDRIREQALNIAKERIKKELSPDINVGNTKEIGAKDLPPEKEELPDSLKNRITQSVKDKFKDVKDYVSNLSAVQRRMLDPRANLDLPTIKYRIRYAGEQNLLLLMKYNGQFRYVEGYSYRVSPKTKKLLFYGYCRIHDKIHAFKLEKIEALIVTSITFSPRWIVETK